MKRAALVVLTGCWQAATEPPAPVAPPPRRPIAEAADPAPIDNAADPAPIVMPPAPPSLTALERELRTPRDPAMPAQFITTSVIVLEDRRPLSWITRDAALAEAPKWRAWLVDSLRHEPRCVWATSSRTRPTKQALCFQRGSPNHHIAMMFCADGGWSLGAVSIASSASMPVVQEHGKQLQPALSSWCQ